MPSRRFATPSPDHRRNTLTLAQAAELAAIVQAAGVVGALIFAGFQLRQSAAIRRDQSRAYVVVFLDYLPELRQFPELVVENLGSTAAYGITLRSDPPIRSSLDAAGGPSIREVGMLTHGIPMLAPGQRVTTLFESMIERPYDWEDTYEIEVTYRDRSKNVWTDTCTLDLISMQKSTFLGEKGIRSISDHLEKLVKEFNELRTGWGGPLQVEVENRVVRRERVAEERRQSREAFEARRSAREETKEVPEEPLPEDEEPWL